MKFATILFLLTAVQFALNAAEPKFYIPFDDSAEVLGAGAQKLKAGIIYGKSGYENGVSGRALDVKRHAYDQVTAVNFPDLPECDLNEGTLSFWFKPHWKENDPEGLWIASGWRNKGFNYYFIKPKRSVIELSVCAPKQIQVLAKNIFRQNEWAHVAFSWSTKKGEVALYIDGKNVGKKSDNSRFKNVEKQPLNLWLGKSGGDRFKANVGNGLYDEIKFFDKVLSPEEIFNLASAGADVKMVSQKPADIFSDAAKTEFVLSDKIPTHAGPAKLAELCGADGAKISIAAMGASGKISLRFDNGKTASTIVSPFVLDLSQPHKITLSQNGDSLSFLLDDAPQGEFANAVFGKLSKISHAENASINSAKNFPTKEQTDALKTPKVDSAEAALWTLDDAEKRESGARRGVCLNGYWRAMPVQNYSYAPPSKKWGYMRVPGSFRSPLYNIHRLKDGKIDAGSEYWGGKALVSFRAGWYQRAFKVPSDFKKGGRIFLYFKNLNGDCGRISLNGKLVDSFRQDFKCFSVIPNERRIDITDDIVSDGQNLLTVFIDRAIVSLWRGVPSIGDHTEIATDDVWLETSPSKVYLRSSLAMPSFKNSELTLVARIANPRSEKGYANVSFEFSPDSGANKTFSKKFELTGEPEQLVRFVEKWRKPILWNAENPAVYKMTTLLEVDSALADSLPPVSFGFREMRVDGGDFKLNGIKTRLRMWTSPVLNRTRHFYGHPNSMLQYVAHIKELNYDTVRFDPFGKTSQLAWSEYLETCDKFGLYNLFQMPPYEDDDLPEYKKQVQKFLEAYGNHPSIIMWYTDFNTCSYPWNQDPAKLVDYAYNPPNKREPRRRAAVAESVMREIDPSRELFQHAGGASGKIFTSMNYQSFGTPLREQEDWPAQWSKNKQRPLMVVESAFPYPSQLLYFDNPKLGTLAAEHAARYFGDSVFADEKLPVPNINVNQISPYADAPRNAERLAAMCYKYVVRAWRAYDVSAVGDFPGGRDNFKTAITYDNHNAVFEIDPDPSVKSSGFRPDNTLGWSETQKHLLTDYTRPAYLCDSVKTAFSPLLVYIGGAPENFTAKDRSFYSGEKIVKSAVVVNDKTSAQKLAFKWSARIVGADAPFASGEFSETVAAGAVEKFPIKISAPEVFKRSDALLSLAVLDGGSLVKEDSFALRIFPKRTAPDFKNASVGLIDPVGKTAAMLKKAGLPFSKVETLDDAKKCRLLIVGQNALSQTPLPLLSQIEDAKLIDRGLKILVFEQGATSKMANLKLESPSCRNAFVRRNSPYIAGLDDADFSDWRGSSDTVPEFVLSDEKSPHYPRSKWKCGNGGIVCGNAIRKPTYGNFETIVDCGFNTSCAALLELRRRHGIVLFCQLDATSRYGIDPAATLLVDNILSNMTSPFLPVGAQRAVYIGSDSDSAILDRMGMEYEKISEKDNFKLNSAQVLIVGGNAPKKLLDAVAKIAANNNSKAVVALPSAPLSVFSDKIRLSQKNFFRATLPPRDPLFAGIAAADLYFRQPLELPVAENLPDWAVSTSPAIFGKIDKATGTNIFFTVNPSDVAGLWNDEKISRIWNSIFNNMNLALGKNLKIFPSSTPTSWSPYLDSLNLYDGDSFHNW